VTFDRFDVALTRFPFTEKRGQKVRPVAVLSDRTFPEAHNHVIGAMITTAANTRWPSDVAIVSYREAGLRTPCVVRLKLLHAATRSRPRPPGVRWPTSIAKRSMTPSSAPSVRNE